MNPARALCARTLCALAALAAAAACSEPPAPPSLSTRVFVDRTEMQVGDAVAVTIEVDAPAGFSVELPAAPQPDPHFTTEKLERLDPVLLPQGTRHRLLWTLRARDLGTPTLPALELPLVRPDGTTQPLVVGAVPLPVRSVREELPEQELYFDVQPPPPARRRGLVAALAGGSALAGLLLVFLLRRRRRRRPVPAPTVDELRRETAVALEEALVEADPRVLLAKLARALWAFVEKQTGLPTSARTAAELPEAADARLGDLLGALERERFRRVCERAAALRLAAEVRAYFADAG